MARVTEDVLAGVQDVIDGLNYALAFLSKIGSEIGNEFKNIF